VIQVAVSGGGYFAGRMPEGEIEGSLPFAVESAEQEYDLYYRYGLFEAMQKVYAERGIYFLPFPTDAIVGLGTSFQAPNPEAVKGKKIRTPGGLWADYIRAIGGNPVVLPWGEIYMGMKLGTIEGWVAGTAALESLKLKEVTKSFVYSPKISTAMTNLLINMDAYKALPKDIQELIDKDSRYVAYAMSQKWHNQCLWALANANKEYGINTYAWSSEDSKRVTKIAVETIFPKVAAKSARCAELLNIVKKQMKDYGRIE